MSVELRRDDFRIVESGSAVQLQAYTGSSHSKPATTNTQKWFQRLRPGIGIVNPEGSYPSSLDGGTIGFFAELKGDADRYLVSCNHVIARQRTTWTKGGVPAETIIQPATMDLTGHDLSILPLPLDLTVPFGVATLHAFVEVQTHASGARSPPSNSADAAIAKMTLIAERMDQLGRLPYAGRLLGTHNFEWDEAAETVEGSPHVFKCGRTTGYTEGTVTHIDGLTTLDFAGAKARFADQLVIEPTPDNTGRFSEPGDSGSPVVTESHELAAMIFAGTERQSWATPIEIVLKSLSNSKDDAGNLIGPLTLCK